MYAPALGFLMFAVGVNLNLAAFVDVLRHPKVSNALPACSSLHTDSLMAVRAPEGSACRL